MIRQLGSATNSPSRSEKCGTSVASKHSPPSPDATPVTRGCVPPCSVRVPKAPAKCFALSPHGRTRASRGLPKGCLLDRFGPGVSPRPCSGHRRKEPIRRSGGRPRSYREVSRSRAGLLARAFAGRGIAPCPRFAAKRKPANPQSDARPLCGSWWAAEKQLTLLHELLLPADRKGNRKKSPVVDFSLSGQGSPSGAGRIASFPNTGLRFSRKVS